MGGVGGLGRGKGRREGQGAESHAPDGLAGVGGAGEEEVSVGRGVFPGERGFLGGEVLEGEGYGEGGGVGFEEGGDCGEVRGGADGVDCEGG
jgi:hypothetical protein